MTVKELSKNELTELKQRYYTENHKTVYMSELCDIDNLVSDKKIFKEYENVDFVEEDFFCNID